MHWHAGRWTISQSAVFSVFFLIKGGCLSGFRLIRWWPDKESQLQRNVPLSNLLLWISMAQTFLPDGQVLRSCPRRRTTISLRSCVPMERPTHRRYFANSFHGQPQPFQSIRNSIVFGDKASQFGGTNEHHSPKLSGGNAVFPCMAFGWLVTNCIKWFGHFRWYQSGFRSMSSLSACKDLVIHPWYRWFDWKLIAWLPCCVFAPGFCLDEWMFKFAASTYFTHHQKEKATPKGNPISNDESCDVFFFLWPHFYILSRSLDLFRCRFRWVAKRIDGKGAIQRWFLWSIYLLKTSISPENW